ncbi:MAG: agmatinase [Gemmatimonadota bacterium]
MSTPAIIGVPWDGASSFMRGAALAPAAIRKAMQSPAGNRWSERLSDTAALGACVDAGDVADDGPMEDAVDAAVNRLLEKGHRPLLLGGDHSITWPAVRALSRSWPSISILHFDAHNDLYDIYEGNRLSHACPFARIMESGSAQELVQIGIRAMTGHQRDQADRFGVDVIDMRRWARGERTFRVTHPLYVSIDIDVLDPSHAPGVSHREPGGLTVRELLTVVQGITNPIIGADIVEYNPTRDADEMTAMVCGKLVREMVDAMNRCPPPC